ncbi:histone-lysine N-methyltransferase SUV39H1-like, partial [Sitodiplosis mosellana]|uniref:histone-lysine N-methyltransferase SUV39H1-like n=1 Tax=Sitodiplosis mosellana TaxID=263140 RepID=UPI002444F288
MSDNLNRYNVEKILDRKVVDDTSFYLIKWQGYSNKDNTWEPNECVDDCQEMLDAYEAKQARRIENVRFNNGRLEYLVQRKDSMLYQIHSSREVFAQWPLLLLEFLQKTVHISGLEPANLIPVKATRTIGNPIRITYMSFLGGEAHYWCEWPGIAGNGKFVPSRE